MSGYGPFARYYDELTANVDYDGHAVFFDKIIRQYIAKAGLVLDLACGTGSLSIALSGLGHDVIGADASPEMLAVATRKACDSPKRILFLNQKMDELDLYGTVDATVCALDSVNHIADQSTLLAAFQRVALFTNPDGLFIFDVNTPYKHREILGNNAFIYDLAKVYCCWQNNYHPKTGRIDITLDFFAPAPGGLYTRETESFSEYIYSDDILKSLLEKTGFELLETFDGDTFEPVSGNAQRLVYIAKKRNG